MLADWLFTLTVAAALIVPITGVVAETALKRRAAGRSLAWVTCFVVLAVLMVCTAATARRRAASSDRALPARLDAAPVPGGPAAPGGVAATIALQGHQPATAAAGRWAAVGDLLRLVWGVGVTLTVWRVVRRHAATWSLGRVATRMPSEFAAELLAPSRHLLGVRRSVAVKLVPGDVPSVVGTAGLRQPVIFLPQSALGWPAARRRRVLLHEMSHVAHADWAIRVVADLVVAILWFHPFVWEASRQLRRGQEDVADDVVLRSDADPYTYATDLVDIAAGIAPPHRGATREA